MTRDVARDRSLASGPGVRGGEGRLHDLALSVGLTPHPGAPGELRAHCPAPTFADAVARMAAGAWLSDLFASAEGEGMGLTAILSMAGDPGWLLVSAPLGEDRFPSLTPRVHAASWYEREIAEMYGLEPVGHPAPARLRLHDWPSGAPPMRTTPGGAVPARPGPDLASVVRGQGVVQLPLGPVRSGPQESAGFLLVSGGEDLVMVVPRLGYKFRAVERLAERQTVEVGLTLAERIAGVSAISNGLAFAHAVERAAGIVPPPGARRARVLLNELERLHHHLGALSRLAEATGLGVAGAQYAILKEEVLRICGRLTGHRYGRGIVAVGGLASPLNRAALATLATVLPAWRRRGRRLRDLLEDTTTFVDRLETTAVLAPEQARSYHLVGPVGRASGVDRDARRDHPYAAYAEMSVAVPLAVEGDALARARVLLDEIEQSLTIVEQALDGCDDREVRADGLLGPGSAVGWTEAPSGECLHYVELDDRGRLRRWRARPPACVAWHPFAHACASGNNLTDYPVIEASFALSHAELDR
ncbi:MAG TPA: NADH-quinone oxidoreductase subunit C [Candidatus Dormibacteraeota bacterium]|nr:NADH-quinone oxidoreductase subunit C [Candidatus Dormibacteraeota bacterium]